MRSNRRDFIKLGVASTAALTTLTTLGGATVLAGCGDTAPAAGLKHLRPADVELIRAMTPSVLAGSVGVGDSAAIEATVRSLDQLLDDLSPQVIAGAHQAFDLLDFGLTRGLMTGQWSSWQGATKSDADDALTRLITSDTEILNAVYGALTRLIVTAWYALPEGAAATGYPGPPKKVPGRVAPATAGAAQHADDASATGLDAGVGPDAGAADAGPPDAATAQPATGVEVGP